MELLRIIVSPGEGQIDNQSNLQQIGLDCIKIPKVMQLTTISVLKQEIQVLDNHFKLLSNIYEFRISCGFDHIGAWTFMLSML